MYQQLKDNAGNIRNDAIRRISDGATIPFVLDNRDYPQFKADLRSGAILNDANGVALTAAQITAFLASIP